MKIWFDLSNSPHVNMFYDLIKELEAQGNKIIITTRPLANTIDLLKQKELEYSVVGGHYGKNFYRKVMGYPVRVIQLVNFLRKQKPDLAVSQSSFHSPLVARILGIPSIYTNDNEHALGNIPSFFFATHVFIPESLAVEKVSKPGASKREMRNYPGVKEGMYLWKMGENLNRHRGAAAESDTRIFIRPEPLTAQYYKGAVNFLDDLILQLQDKYSVTVLVRDKTQLVHYNQAKFYKVSVPVKPLKLEDIAQCCSLSIGAGGSMTRELAVLGVPTISVYQDHLLEVDKYLIEKGRMFFEPNLTAEQIDNYINQFQEGGYDGELLAKGKQAYNLFKTEILNYSTL